MSYKTLLVHLDDLDRCAVRVALALDLAERFDAHLTGLYLPQAGAQTPDDASTPQARLERARERFFAAGERAGRAVEWRAPQPCDVDTATLHARHADLLVLGQDDADRPAESAGSLAAELVMTAARPVVVVPSSGTFAEFAQNILIAWDGSREAARATADAMPLLQRARCVSIEMVVERHGAKRLSADEEAIEAAAWLELHGVRASFHESIGEPGIETGIALMSRANDLHADTIVAGAYAHSRIVERMLGGVTRTLLETTTVPAFLSH